MKTSSVLLAASLTLTGVASAVALASNGPVLAGGMFHERRHAGPDSARVEAFLGALHATDPMICEMVTDQLGNFWSSSGDDGVGLIDGVSRSWEESRDSLASPVTDAAAQRRVIKALGDDDTCVRRAAAKMAGRSTPALSAALKTALRSGSPRVREAAALAMGHGDEKEFKDNLDRATRDDSPAVVAMATWALGELELPAETEGRLIELAGSRDVRVRRTAAWGLGQNEDIRGVPALVSLLRDADASTRAIAAEALGQLDGLESAPSELIDALGSSDVHLRRKAAEALSSIHDVKAVPALGRYINDPDLETRRAVVQALAEIEDDSTVPFLLRAIKDSDPEIRKTAAEALGNRKDN